MTPVSRRRLTVVIATGVVTGTVVAGGLSFQRFRSNMNANACGGNLHAIGQGILLYQVDHGGRYPDTLGQIVDPGGPVTPGALVCPAADQTAADGPTTRAVAAAVDGGGGHCSYVYVGRGLTEKTVTDTTVVAYEPVANHGDGGHVLYGDGHADWVAAGPLAEVAASTAAAGQR